MQTPEPPDKKTDTVAPILPGDTPPANIDTALLNAGTLTIHFDNFADGRGLSLATHLRQALGFTGKLQASGPLLPDQLRELFAVGFNAVFYEDEHTVSDSKSSDPIVSRTYIHPASRTDAPSVWRQRHQ